MDPGPSMFISYRRADTGWAAHVVAGALRGRLRSAQVFLDNSSIPLGAAFADIIDAAIRRCDVMIVLIGPRWDEPPFLERLHDPADLVRREVLRAKELAKVIVPVLVDRTHGLAAAVPEDLRFLHERNRYEVRQGYVDDVELLAMAVTDRPRTTPSAPSTPVTRPDLDWLLRQTLPLIQQLGGNRDRLVDLALTVLGTDERLELLAPGRLPGQPRGSATVLVTELDLMVVTVGSDLQIHGGEIRLPRALINRVEVLPTLLGFADVVVRTSDGATARLADLVPGQARALADLLRRSS